MERVSDNLSEVFCSMRYTLPVLADCVLCCPGEIYADLHVSVCV